MKTSKISERIIKEITEKRKEALKILAGEGRNDNCS